MGIISNKSVGGAHSVKSSKLARTVKGIHEIGNDDVLVREAESNGKGGQWQARLVNSEGIICYDDGSVALQVAFPNGITFVEGSQEWQVRREFGDEAASSFKFQNCIRVSASAVDEFIKKTLPEIAQRLEYARKDALKRGFIGRIENVQSAHVTELETALAEAKERERKMEERLAALESGLQQKPKRTTRKTTKK